MAGAVLRNTQIRWTLKPSRIKPAHDRRIPTRLLMTVDFGSIHDTSGIPRYVVTPRYAQTRRV